jgi:LacI family transcriptional regulator
VARCILGRRRVAGTNEGRRVTILDLARHARVSKSLVSRVMRGSTQVSRERRTAVLCAAEELGYRPNALARGMRTRTNTVGVLLSELHNPFFAEVVDGIEEELYSAGYSTLLGGGWPDPRREMRAIDSMLELKMDGIMLVAPSIPESDIAGVAREIPAVLVGQRTRNRTLDCVVNDDYRGTVLAVEYLAGLGHERIAHIGGGEDDGTSRDLMPHLIRARGYGRAMRRLGLERHACVAIGRYTEEGGYSGTRALLERDPPATAIFAGNDLVAIGAMTALEEAGLSVPGDISIVGYDNTHLAAMRHLSLTSVDQPRRRMGVIAAGMLLERIESGRDEPVTEVLAPTLVPRSTSAPPTSGAQGVTRESCG